MGRKKKAHLAELEAWPHVLMDPKERPSKFGEEIVLEVGCGRGDYTLALAEQNPNRHFIGFDCKGDRLWHGAKIASEKGLKNVHFIRGRAEALSEWFQPYEVAEIILPFSDPHPRPKKAKHRLTSRLFLEEYRKILRPKGRLFLKTDHEDFFEFSLQEIQDFGAHLESLDRNVPSSEIQTLYERRFRAEGKPIFSAIFVF